MMKKLSGGILGGATGLLPLVALAQGEFKEISDFVGNITEFINDVLIPLIFAIALIVFLWGVFEYFIRGGSDPDKRSEGTQLMLYSVIGFVLMVSIFGIVNLVANGLGLNENDDISDQLPKAPKVGN